MWFEIKLGFFLVPFTSDVVCDTVTWWKIQNQQAADFPPTCQHDPFGDRCVLWIVPVGGWGGRNKEARIMAYLQQEAINVA